MYEIRQIIVRLRLGESDREVARAQAVGRKTVAAVRQRAQAQGWLDAATALPADDALAQVLQPTRVRRGLQKLRRRSLMR